MKCDSIDQISKDLERLLAKQQGDTAKKPSNIFEDIESFPESHQEGERIPEPEPEEGPESESDTEWGPPARKRERVSRRHWDKRRTGSGQTGKGMVRPNDGLLMAFFVPIIIMMIIIIQRGIYPFGEESFLRTDMYHQYAPFFSEFQYKLKHGGSLLYSWDIGMGVNFMALYAYYLASPFNWLIILCPQNLVAEFMTYAIVLKIGLSGLTMAYYLRRHCGRRDFGIGFFGIFYALSGYMAAYSWNIMWLDCILLFPLIMLGLERLVKKGKGMLYCLMLGLSILSNYYISIMICIFMLVYFIALLILEDRLGWKKFIRSCGLFSLYSLLAGGLASVVLLPEIYALQTTASSNFSFPKSYSSYFSIFDMVARHIGNVETEIGLDHWPNLYCGVAIFLFFLLYLGSSQINRKEKVVYCGILLFFYASFSTNILNFLWHGFHYPNSLPSRQSFIYIFIMLLICYRAYMYLDVIPKRNMGKVFLAACAFVIMAEKLVEQEHFHFSVYYVAILILAAYAGLFYLYKRGRRFHMIAAMLTLSLVAIEAAVNMTVTSVTTTSRTAYVEDNAAVRSLMEILPEDDIYRVEKVTRKTKNDGAWMNFPSVSLFSSTANADLSELFKKLGCESSTNAYSITGSTPLVDMLFGVKYGLYTDEDSPSGIRTLLGWEESTYLYENTYSMPIAWGVRSDFEQDWYLDLGDPAEVQNNLADLTGSAHVLNLVMDGQDNGERYTFFPERSGDYYAYINNSKVEKVSVVKDSGTKSYNNINRGYFVEIGYCEAGEEIILRSETSAQNLNAMVYRFSEEALEEVYNNLNRSPLVVGYYDDSFLEGRIQMDEAGVLFTTIPYDEGWSVRMDGIPCEVGKIAGAFLSVEVPAGNHRFTFEYTPRGLTGGAFITIGSSLLLLFIFLGGKWASRNMQDEDDYYLDEEEIME